MKVTAEFPPTLEAGVPLLKAKGWSWARGNGMLRGSSGPIEGVGGITLFRGTPFQIIALDDPHPPGTPDCCEDNFHVRVGGPGQLSTEAKVASIEQAVYWLSVILPAIDKEHHKRNVGDVVDATMCAAEAEKRKGTLKYFDVGDPVRVVKPLTAYSDPRMWARLKPKFFEKRMEALSTGDRQKLYENIANEIERMESLCAFPDTKVPKSTRERIKRLRWMCAKTAGTLPPWRINRRYPQKPNASRKG